MIAVHIDLLRRLQISILIVHLSNISCQCRAWKPYQVFIRKWVHYCTSFWKVTPLLLCPGRGCSTELRKLRSFSNLPWRRVLAFRGCCWQTQVASRYKCLIKLERLLVTGFNAVTADGWMCRTPDGSVVGVKRASALFLYIVT